MAAGWKLDGDVESAIRHQAFVACLAFYADSEDGLPEIELHHDIERGIISLTVNGELVRDGSSEDFLLVLNHGNKTDLELRQSTQRELAEIYLKSRAAMDSQPRSNELYVTIIGDACKLTSNLE